MGRKLLMGLLLIVVSAAAYAAGVTFKFSPDAGATKPPTGLTDALFPQPRASRDPIIPTAMIFDVVQSEPTPAVAEVPATSTSPAIPAKPAGWLYTARRVRLDPWSIYSVEAGQDEMQGYTRLLVAGGAVDNGLTMEASIYYVRGDFPTISALIDKMRGANPAVNVTFTEQR